MPQAIKLPDLRFLCVNATQTPHPREISSDKANEGQGPPLSFNWALRGAFARRKSKVKNYFLKNMDNLLN